MAYRDTRLGLLIRFEPRKAARQILAMYRRKHGNATHVAAALGVDRRTLGRWLQSLRRAGADISGEVEVIREAVRDQAAEVNPG